MWGWIAVNFGLFVFGTIQIFLSPPDEDPASGWVHGLHGLFALFVLVYAAYIAHRDMRWLGLRGTPPGSPRWRPVRQTRFSPRVTSFPCRGRSSPAATSCSN